MPERRSLLGTITAQHYGGHSVAKARPFSRLAPRRFRLIKRMLQPNQKFDLAGKKRLASKRRKINLITLARLAAAKFVRSPFGNKRKSKPKYQ